MFSYITGKLVALEKDAAVLDNGGIGWLLFVPATVQKNLGALGEEVKLYTYLAVREDALQLYGFSQPEELNLFKQLLTVTGIGPRVALSIISTLSAADFYLALMHENIKMLTRVPGVGQKTARRLIVELKEKVPALSLPAATMGTRAETNAASNIYNDAMEALLSLGFQGNEAQDALRAVGCDESMTTEELVRKVLAHISTL